MAITRKYFMKNTNIKYKIKNTIKKFESYKTSLFKESNENQVLLIGAFTFLSIILFLSILTFLIGKDLWKNSNGIWTLITAIFSSPVLFIIWRLRDNNITEQINIQRKDISLKEFQKLSEWVSGSHLSEIDNDNGQESNNINLYSYNKRDGELGLQISAVYNLQPFFTGFYGDDFRKPAMNLLLTSWLVLQNKEVNSLINSKFPSEEYFKHLNNIKTNASSPLAIAITRVLLIDGGKHLKKFPEVFPNLCLAGMNFNLPGIDKNISNLFENEDCSGIILIASNIEKMKFNNSILKHSYITGVRAYKAEFKKANLREAKLYDGLFDSSTFEDAILDKSDLTLTRAFYVNFTNANFKRAKLKGTKLHGSNLSESNFHNAKLIESKLISINVNNANFKSANIHNCKIENTNFSAANTIPKSLRK